MTNEIWWFVFLLFDFCMVLLAAKLFGKNGLFLVIITGIIICNIQVVKLVTIFGQIASIGNIAYGGIYLATDLLSEVYGKKEAQRGVLMGLFALIVFTISMQISLNYAPLNQGLQDAMLELFNLTPRIAFASLVAYVFSQTHDVWAFDLLKKRTNGKHLWLRNNLSTIVSQFIDTVIFIGIAFIGVFDGSIVWSLFITTYMFKVLVALFDTPVIYIGRRILQKQNVA